MMGAEYDAGKGGCSPSLSTAHDAFLAVLDAACILYQSVILELWDQVLILHCKTFWA